MRTLVKRSISRECGETMININLFSNKAQNFTLLVLLSVFLLILISPPAAAQIKSGDLLQQSIDAAQVSEEAMDNLWDALFAPDALLYNQIIQLATIIEIIGFPFMMMAFARASRDGDSAKVGEIIAWGLVIVIFLQSNGAMLKVVTKGIRSLINDQAVALLEVQVDTLTIRDAMKDVILTEQLRDRIHNAATECEAKEGAAQLECMSEAADFSEEIVEEYEKKGFLGNFPGLKRLAANVRAQIKKYREDLTEAKDDIEKKAANDQANRELDALFFHTITGAANKAVLKSFQNWFTYGFEFALMLTGMLGPLAVAASLIPKSPRALFSWLIGMASIGILKLSYNLVVGFAALYASEASIAEAGSAGFLTMISFGAPFIAVAVAGGGGAAIFFALGKTTAMVATVIPIAGSVASGAASAVPPPPPSR